MFIVHECLAITPETRLYRKSLEFNSP